MTTYATEWANGIPFSEQDKIEIDLVRKAGCKCDRVLLGYIPNQGPRCRFCGCESYIDIRKIKAA